ncbi:unnamed protein product [Larinioides sclopetarius]|uniref:UV excision repair protein RAD23 n=1 Tax=Larinioides sclopetarius TaxID=280406 RepID=A0AAV1YRD4_9ARAC
MLITLKTLQEDLFTVEVDPSQTVRHFKENIEKVRGDAFPAKYTKLMYAGKFLLDTKRVCDYDLEEKKFVILVVKKPRRSVVKEEEPDPAEAPFMNASSSSSAERDRILCAEHEQLVQHIVELGFSRTDVERALCASFNNPDRAVEYLINGVASGSSRSNQPAASQSRPSEDPSDSSDANLLNHMSRPDPPNSRESILPSQERIFELFSEALAECQNHTREQDRMLEADHELITQNYAEMEAAGISDPRGAFDNINSASVSPEDLPNGMFSGTDGMFDIFNDAFSGAGALGMSGTLLDRDHEAIERLKQLGFSDNKVIEAYFVCDRDENAAADYLFSQKFE